VGLGNLYLTLGKFDDAVRELEAAAQSPYAPGSVVAQWVRTKAARLKATNAKPEEWLRLEEGLKAAAGACTPVSCEPVVLLAELGTAVGKTKEAVQLLKKEAARRPGDTYLWVALADATADAQGTAAGLAVLDEAQSASGDNPDVRLARAR